MNGADYATAAAVTLCYSIVRGGPSLSSDKLTLAVDASLPELPAAEIIPLSDDAIDPALLAVKAVVPDTAQTAADDLVHMS